jgi:molybdopterin-guanine dinucleotide biosynthesis protein MobB
LQLVPLLKARGLRLAVIKHAHHDFDVDRPGKDSYRLRRAGADAMLVASRRRVAMIRESPERPDEPELAELVAELDPAQFDLVLVEGFKRQRFAKIEVHRAALGMPLLCRRDDSIIALATDGPAPGAPAHLARLPLNEPRRIADFLVEHTGLRASPRTAGTA